MKKIVINSFDLIDSYESKFNTNLLITSESVFWGIYQCCQLLVLRDIDSSESKIQHFVITCNISQCFGMYLCYLLVLTATDSCESKIEHIIIIGITCNIRVCILGRTSTVNCWCCRCT